MILLSFPLFPAGRNFVRRPHDSIWNQLPFSAYSFLDMGPFSGANDDAQLMLRVARGDRSAFEALYDRFSTPLYSLALKMLGNEAEARDLLQEVFLAIWNKAPGYYADRGSTFAWVVSLLRNRAIDRIRARRRRGEWTEIHRKELEPTGSTVATSAHNLELSERAKEVRAALDQIAEEQRQVLRLAWFEGLTQAEIAEKLEEPLGTIKARAARGMARLRLLLRSHNEQ